MNISPPQHWARTGELHLDIVSGSTTLQCICHFSSYPVRLRPNMSSTKILGYHPPPPPPSVIIILFDDQVLSCLELNSQARQSVSFSVTFMQHIKCYPRKMPVILSRYNLKNILPMVLKTSVRSNMTSQAGSTVVSWWSSGHTSGPAVTMFCVKITWSRRARDILIIIQ